MKFSETPLPGAYQIDLEELHDDRGFFARSFCARDFEKRGLKLVIAQSSISYNHRKGTLSGMHYQMAPACEAKLVRCTAGAIWDVIIDIRPDSRTYLQHFTTELSARNRRAVYIPEMFAHGYITLCDNTEISYAISEFYTPGVAGGYRYDDPVFAIDWPVSIDVISDKDTAWPLIGDTP